MSRNFTSDNVTPACAAIMAALQAANVDAVPSYGGDAYTARLEALLTQIFETDVAAFPVATGTAANALALAQLTPPYGTVICHEAAHVATDECGAPEFFMGGGKLTGLPSGDGKIRADQVAAVVALADSMGVHHVKPAAVSLTQSTEWGTVYSLDQVAELSAMAKRHGLRVHMDGARFANALVHLGCTPAAATWRSGVDVLSLGATKNGALAAEVVVFFDPTLAREVDRRRKRAGHLWSKMRFLSAQLVAYLEDDLWLHNARQANAMAAELARGFGALPGARLLQTTDANEVFVALPERQVAVLERAGFGFYRWPGCPVTNGEAAIRLVTSYATQARDVAVLLDAAHAAARA